MKLGTACGVLGAFVSFAAGAAAAEPPAYPEQLRWIWYPEGGPSHSMPEATRYFRGTVTVPPDLTITAAQFIVNIDDGGTPYVNGKRLAKKTGGWPVFETYDVGRLLRPGKNVIGVEAENHASIAGVIGWLVVRTGKEKRVLTVTDGSWKASTEAKPGWAQPGFDDAKWPAAQVLGTTAMAPWGGKMHYNRLPMMTLATRAPGKPVSAQDAQTMIEEDWIFQADPSATTAKRGLSRRA